MSRALSIESSGRISSVALVENEQVLAEQQFPHGLQNAAQMLPLIDGMMRERAWEPKSLDQVYLSVGPGSFTGLRIAVTLAKTLAFATGAKIVAVPTLRVLVENAPADAREVIILLDAKREQVFTARYTRGDDGWIEQESPRLDSVTNMLARAPRPVHLLGEGIPYHRQFIPDEPGIVVTAEDAWRARAGVVAQLAIAMTRRGEFADPFTLTPTYIRKPEALEKWEIENAKNG